MLSKCVNCGFYVRQDDEFCFNCGIIDPIKPLQANVLSFFFFWVLISPFFSLLMTIAVFYNTYFISLTYASLVFLSFLAVMFIFGYFIKKFFKTNKIKREKLSTGLITKHNVIAKRLSELNSRGQKIDTILDKIKETDGQNLQEVRQKLLSAREIVVSQFARYELQKNKIELVRLQNSVSPYLFALHRLNEFETENGLVSIEMTKAEVNEIRQNLTNYVAIEFPAQTLNEKEHFLSQLSETEDSCEKLREALLSKQAAHALQGISLIEENLKLQSAKEIVHSAETFNIQTTLTDFSESFEELEREYRHVRAENEVSQKLLDE